jgi:hypothetical protein
MKRSPKSDITIDEWFWQQVDKSGDCWNWTYTKDPDGYGVFTFASKNYRAHRYSFEAAFGWILKGFVVDHHCDNPSCVRPDHLWLGTVADNNADRAAKGRSATGSRNGAVIHRDKIAIGVLRARREKPEVFVRGERCHLAKLNADQVREIRALYAKGGIKQSTIAEQFGVTQVQVSSIIRRASWAHI